MDLLELWTICSANNIVMDREQMRNLERYAEELKYWNSKVNLISRKDEDNIFKNHILHSLSIVKFIEPNKKAKFVDIGTGGGLPGIPIKIALPDITMSLVDSIKKKIKITDMLAKHTGLNKINAYNSRAEELSKLPEHKNEYDYVVARAVSKIVNLIEWGKSFLNNNGMFVFLKGGDLSDEIEEAINKFPTLSIREEYLNIRGADWFEKEDKKILICKL